MWSLIKNRKAIKSLSPFSFSFSAKWDLQQTPPLPNFAAVKEQIRSFQRPTRGGGIARSSKLGTWMVPGSSSWVLVLNESLYLTRLFCFDSNAAAAAAATLCPFSFSKPIFHSHVYIFISFSPFLCCYLFTLHDYFTFILLRLRCNFLH